VRCIILLIIREESACFLFWMRKVKYGDVIRVSKRIVFVTRRVPEGKNHLEDLDVDGKILEWILGKQNGKVWTGCIWLRIGTTVCLL